MTVFLLGLALLAASFGLEMAPQLFDERLQFLLKILCVLTAIFFLFRQPNVQFTKSKARSTAIGFSVLVPAAICWFIYHRVLAMPLGIDPDGLYSFLLWSVFTIGTIPVWGQILRLTGVITFDEQESFKTWRVLDLASSG